ncbi:MAG TPA: TonB-dependent receptor [Phnomibacter sp.]|nr:TonB-dependent receptor [Phnomibacter sp.]
MKTIYTKLLSIAVLFIISLGTPLALMAQAPDSTAKIIVQGLCGMCKDRIQTAAKGKGVTSAVWDEKTKELTVVYNPKATTLDKIENRIVEAGHDVGDKKANAAVYEALPGCCHYRDEKKLAPTEHSMQGVILEESAKGEFKPLTGASVIWLHSGKGTSTNSEGVFSIPFTPEDKQLIVSYTGYHPDTIAVNPNEAVMVVLARKGTLQEVKVTARQRSLYISTTNAFRTQVMSEKELYKAACCNLSESFETNPSVDVSYNDAVTGSKQIQLLGLSGNYTQLTVENLPGPRGLATPMGLNYIPGTWVESIQLTKGTGSVANGFESIAGQINVELKKPETAEKLYANAYVNTMGKTDLNLNLTQKMGKKWSTALLLHDAFLTNKMDFNEDGYIDLPTGNLFTAENRWKYEGTDGWMTQFGFKVLTDRKQGGEIKYNEDTDKGTTNAYGLAFNTDRYEGFAKIGYVFPQKKYQSIGLQLSTFKHTSNSYYGLTNYDASQNNMYANLIYQSIIGNTNHKFRTGMSVMNDVYKETLNQQKFDRTETVPGAFLEYTYDHSTKLSLVAGIRADHNNLYGWIATPRLNVRYQPFKNTTVRLSAGRGQRTSNIIAENTGVLVSARQFEILHGVQGKAYGLDPETSWNKGISIDQKFKLFNRDANIGADYFRNDFTNQVVVDLEDARKASFYNLDGKSYSNSFQVEMNVQPLHKFDVRLAYRLFDVNSTYDGNLMQKPLLSKHRGFLNLAYETHGFKFDYTLTYNGSKRIPSTGSNPAQYVQPTSSPAYVLMNAQVSKSLGKNNAFEVYLGGENLGNYIQKNAIVAPEDPFGNYFDASLVWGPVTGRMAYTGIRYKIK